MLNSHQVLLLYTRILEDDSFINCISEKDMKQAIEHMHKIYLGSTNNLSKNLNCLTDFNTVTYRCAYLFKYAPFHTALAYKAMSHALTENPYKLQAALDSLSGPLKLCSLGGGPGTDVIGVLAAMHDKFGFFPISAKLVDIMSEWELTFCSVLDELRFGDQFYGSLSESVNEKWFDWSFTTADLQGKMSKELIGVLGAADIITMVKFVSAAACKETSNMIEKIFKIMKPGAFLLFVDNAGGGFEKLISSAASKYKLNTVFKPLKHQHYVNEIFNHMNYGYRSCYESKVAVQLLMKSSSANYSKEINLSSKENIPSSPMPLCQKMHVPQFRNFRIGPKSVDNLMNEHESFESGSPFNCYGSNFSPSSEFSPTMDRLKAQFNSPVSHYKSFESDSSWSSSPYTSASHNWPIRDKNQIYDSDYQNESFGHELSLNNGHYSNETDMPHQGNFPPSPPSFWEKIHVPKLYNFKNYSCRVDNSMNEYDTLKYGSFPKYQAGSFSSSSEFSPELGKAKSHTNLLESHYKSFESKLPLNLPLNSTPQTSRFQRRSVRAVDQVHDSAYGNELIECKVSWNMPINNSLLPTPVSTNNSLLSTPVSMNNSLLSTPVSMNNSLLPTPVSTNNSLLPTPVSQTEYISRLNTTATDDSGYPEESFEVELSQDSPVYNSLLHFRASQRRVRYKIPKRKAIYSFHGNGSFSNTSVNSLPQHSTLMHHGENSLSPEPYKPNSQWLNHTTSMSFKGIDNSVYNQSPMNSESSLHQSWNDEHHPYGILQHSDKYKTPKQSHVSVFQHEPYELARPWTNQSKNGSLSLKPSHQPLGKNKVSKRHGNVSMHRHKPYQLKRSRI